MPAYNFQLRFAVYVKNGTKKHTVRSRRKRPAKIGDTLYLYTGLRTKYAQKIIGDQTCSHVRTIVITDDGDLALFDVRISEEALIKTILDLLSTKEGAKFFINKFSDEYNYRILTSSERDEFAWNDGFRGGPDNRGSFMLMLRYWRKTHSLPFVGDIIYW